MGYPDSFQIVVSDSQAYKQFGNSVVVPIVEGVGIAVRDALAGPTSKRDMQLALTENGRAFGDSETHSVA